MTSRTSHALRVLLEPNRGATFNMQRDLELLESHAVRGPEPWLRIYSWNPPAISLGHMQHAATLLDLEACARDGIEVVKRPTGGRAILHWQEVTYALIGSSQDPHFAPDLRAAHQVIAECLATALQRLGVETEFSRPTRDPERQLLRQPCFVSSGRAELLVHGRKLVGSAQRRRAGAFLQHGSLLVGPAHEQLVHYLRETQADPGARRIMLEHLREKTTHLSEILGDAPGFGVLARALMQGFSERLELPVHLESKQISEASAS